MSPRVLAVDASAPEPAVIRDAAAVLRGGGLVAFPTETVYGLGANALEAAAVRRIFVAKGRPASDPLIVHVLGADDLAAIGREVPVVAQQLADAFWPGPLTLVVPRGARVPDVVTAGLDSVAVRAPSHAVARALIDAAGVPVAAPSANPFGRTSPTTAAHVIDDLGDRVDLVLDGGPTPVGIESTVVDTRTTPPRVLRPGGVTMEALSQIVPDIRLAAPNRRPDARPRSPGQLARHYAPRAPLVLLRGPNAALTVALAAAARALAADGRRVGLLVTDEDVAALPPLPEPIVVRAVGSRAAPADIAQRLFGTLRALDAADVAVILARDVGAAGLALAVRDRLTRAAEGRVITVSADAPAAAASNVRQMLTGGTDTDAGSGADTGAEPDER